MIWPTCVHKYKFLMQQEAGRVGVSKFVKSIIIIRNDVIVFVCFFIFTLHHCCLAVSVNFEYRITHHAAIIIHPYLPCRISFYFLFFALEYLVMRNEYLFVYINFNSTFIHVWAMGKLDARSELRYEFCFVYWWNFSTCFSRKMGQTGPSCDKE